MRTILSILIVILLTSCKTDQPTVPSSFIDGHAPGVYNGMRIYLNKLGQGNNTQSIDTAIVMNERFSFDKDPNIDFAQLRFLTMDTSEDRLVFIMGQEPIEFTINKDTLSASQVKGDLENEILYDFRINQKKYKKVSDNFKQQRGDAYRSGNQDQGDAITKEWMNAEEAYKNKIITTIQNNPQKLVSSMMIGELINAKLIDTKKATELFDILNGSVTKSNLYTQLKNYLDKFNKTAIGSKAPYFEGNSPEGETIKLTDVVDKGKVTLIDFWASWCGPCRRENPNVVEAYKKYNNKGFNIISVSLDRPNAQKAWKAAIEKDQMDWYHISRLMYWNDPIAKLYNVTGIPATFLVDENGVIIAKNLRGFALHDKLEELL